MDEYLKYIIYTKDNKQGSICIICKYLVHFKPDIVLPNLLPKLYETLNRPDMNYSTIMKIFIVIITVILNRKNYKKGLYEILNIMENT